MFDKTGTLTHGAPTLVAIRPENGFGEDEVLTAVASAEQYSSHVLATSIIAAAHDRGLHLSEAEWAREAATNGVQARVGSREVVVGKFRFVAEHAPDAARTRIAPGQLAVYVAIDDPDEHHARAKAAGAEILRELADTDYGSRDYAARDLDGNEWYFGTYRP